jgi:Intracellular proteinase inhibitor
MSRKVSLWVLCTLIVTLAGGCSDSPTEPEGSVEVRAVVSQATVRPFEQLNWEVTVTNNTSRPARLDFASGCLYNFQVFRGSQVVWDLSAVVLCPQGVTSVELQPGESRRGTGTWNVHDLSGSAPAPGEYEARGSVLTQPRLTSQPVRITVQG